jgi:hypothetical protein
MDPKTTAYLNNITAGLRDDPELRLDVRAELAAHVEDKAEDLRRGGASEDEAQTQAVAALGEVTEVAAGLERGNRRRLNRRAWARRLLRFALVPAAVVIAVLCSDLQWAEAFGMVGQMDGGPVGIRSWLDELATRASLRTPKVPLFTASPRELWESEPGNRIYYADYITHDVATTLQSTTTPADEKQRESLLAILETARTLDPDNARYDYLRAAILLRGACEVNAEDGPKGPDGKRGLGTLTWKIQDRARLDQAMAHLLCGLRKPEFRRYGKEMLALRLEAMGPANRLVQRIQRFSVSASTLLPDLATLRQLARVSYLYGDQLAQEGRVEEARPFLDAWKTLTIQLNSDSWTLIDCLVVTALASGLPEHSARVYERLGLADAAARSRHDGDLLGRPGREWRERRNDPAVREADAVHWKEMRLYAGVLTGVLLPTLNERPTRQEYAASRRLEYAVAMQAGATLLSALLLAAMLACLVISLRWRFVSGGEVIPILLLPDATRVVQTLVLGVVLPLALFAGVVLFVPISGQWFSANAAMHKVLGEFLLLATAILLVPTWLTVREARRRCRELGIPYGRSAAVWGLVPLLLGVVAVAATWWVPPRPTGPSAAGMGSVIVTALVLAVTAPAAGLFLLLSDRKHGLYAGTVARSLIPTFAAAVVLLCVTTRPLLLRAERRGIAADTLIMTGPGEVGFSRIESQVTARLRKAVAGAAAGLDKR